MGNKIGSYITLDGEREFKSAVQSCNKSLSTLKSEMNLVETQSKGQANLIISLHLDAGRSDYQGDNDTGGCTVLVIGYHAIASQMVERIEAAVSSALKICNRGVVIRNALYVLAKRSSNSDIVPFCRHSIV